MIQANSFRSPVPLIVGPSAESRRHDSTQGAVPIGFLLGAISRAGYTVGRITKKVTFHDVNVDTIEVVVDDEPVLTEYMQTDETKSRLV